MVNHTTGIMLIRDMLMQRIYNFDSTSNGFLSATSFAGKMYFDKLQNGPPIYDVVNLQVRCLKILVQSLILSSLALKNFQNFFIFLFTLLFFMIQNGEL